MFTDEPRAPDLLRKYLATRDTSCESCGYSLRGVERVKCPECGTVIPRPPGEFIARMQADPASLRLVCQDCGYAVTGVDAPCCPECESPRLVRFTGNSPPRPRGQRIPVPIKVTTALGGLVSVTALCIGIVSILAGGPAGTAGQTRAAWSFHSCP